jgi:acyl-coenzyme A thioesterase PaaI-like protein
LSDDSPLGTGVPEPFRGTPGTPASSLPGGVHWERLADATAEFLDQLAGAVPDDATVAALADDLAAWGDKLRGLQVGEVTQAFGHRVDLDGRGQTMAPRFVLGGADDLSVHGTVRFGHYFLGGNGAVHGGVIPLLFDEVMGRLANSGGRTPGRTAYLKTDYRSITPVGKDLSVRVWIDREEGRKRFLRGEIRNDGVLCADAEALVVALRQGQP